MGLKNRLYMTSLLLKVLVFIFLFYLYGTSRDYLFYTTELYGGPTLRGVRWRPSLVDIVSMGSRRRPFYERSKDSSDLYFSSTRREKDVVISSIKTRVFSVGF